MLKFSEITQYKQGMVFSFLSQSFVGTWNDEPEEKIQRFDRKVFENPDTAQLIMKSNYE